MRSLIACFLVVSACSMGCSHSRSTAVAAGTGGAGGGQSGTGSSGTGGASGGGAAVDGGGSGSAGTTGDAGTSVTAANCNDSSFVLHVHSGADLLALTSCTSFAGYMEIANTDITSLDGLDNMVTIEELNIAGNAKLTSIDALKKLTTVEHLSIMNNSALTSIAALGHLTAATVIGSSSALAPEVIIGGNPALTSLAGLDALNTIEGQLQISSNAALGDLTGLGKLSNVGQGVHIKDNAALKSLTGLDSLTTLTGGLQAALQIEHNPQLTKLATFPKLSTVDGDVVISNNATLPQACADALVTALGAKVTGTVMTSGNASGACP